MIDRGKLTWDENVDVSYKPIFKQANWKPIPLKKGDRNSRTSDATVTAKYGMIHPIITQDTTFIDMAGDNHPKGIIVLRVPSKGSRNNYKEHVKHLANSYTSKTLTNKKVTLELDGKETIVKIVHKK
jgi:hypothetical protein